MPFELLNGKHLPHRNVHLLSFIILDFVSSPRPDGFGPRYLSNHISRFAQRLRSPQHDTTPFTPSIVNKSLYPAWVPGQLDLFL